MKKAVPLNSNAIQMKKIRITKNILTTRVIIYQLIGYGILLFLIAGDEVFDFPHTVFGFQATPTNWVEALIESSYIIVLCLFSIYLSLRLLKEIKFLEGYLPICSFCKKIRDGKDWRSIEGYVSEHSEALFSHGLCPECAEKHYGEFIHRDKDTSSSEKPDD
jgi:hypothetical protein